MTPKQKRWEQVGFPTKTSRLPLGKTPPSPTIIPHTVPHHNSIASLPNPTCIHNLYNPTCTHDLPNPTCTHDLPHPSCYQNSPHPHLWHSSFPPTPISINQGPTTNVSQVSPTTGPPNRPKASPPELCPSDQDESFESYL